VDGWGLRIDTRTRPGHAVALGHGLAACECLVSGVRVPAAQLAQHVRVGNGMVGRVFFSSTARPAPRALARSLTARTYRVSFPLFIILQFVLRGSRLHSRSGTPRLASKEVFGVKTPGFATHPDSEPNPIPHWSERGQKVQRKRKGRRKGHHS
jgi:hypothetical protein